MDVVFRNTYYGRISYFILRVNVIFHVTAFDNSHPSQHRLNSATHQEEDECRVLLRNFGQHLRSCGEGKAFEMYEDDDVITNQSAIMGVSISVYPSCSNCSHSCAGSWPF